MTSETALEPFAPSGQPLHTRTLVVELFQGKRGRVRVDGVILDLRKVGFVPTGGDLQTAGFIHHMELHLEVDAASARIERLETAQPTVAFEPGPASGGDCCRDPAPRLQALVGEALDAGFPRRLARVFGGPLGCSHLLTLAQLVGASVPRFLAASPRLAVRTSGERIAKRNLSLDGFERPDGALEIAIQLSDFQLRPAAEVALPLDRLAHQHELRLLARVDREISALVAIDAAERGRDAESLELTPWRSRRARVAPLEGGPALRGLAARVLEAVGDDADAPLRDALLNLAPGVIQCLAALSHRLVAQLAGGSSAPGRIPRELSVGGWPDSCYMWRSEGPMARARARASEA